LLPLDHAHVMAIGNITPDSFYAGSRYADDRSAVSWAMNSLESGATILDLGACSTRPHSAAVSAQEEWQRLCPILKAIRRALPEANLSVDTFRPEVARRSMEEGADMINDISGGDEAMYEVIVHYHCPYVLTHNNPAVALDADPTHVVSEVLDDLQQRLDHLYQMGIADVIVDPGFGFGKTTEQNYAILRQMDVLAALSAPVMVGLSRKSMLYQPTHRTAETALEATTAANMIALEKGANMLRVHDVQAAMDTITIYALTHPNL